MKKAVLAIIAALLLVPASASANPLQLVEQHAIDARLSELTFRTPSVTGDTKVRVLVPEGYDASGTTRYPMLLLLHGASDDYRSWTDKGNAEAATKSLNAIVVMPDSGTGAGYVNWYNNGAFGPPEWETYHLYQLLPWIDEHYPTIGRRSGRAISGLSMGGYGTMEYAARRPDLFSAALAFSPAVDLTSPGLLVVNQASEASGSTPAYGLYPTEEIRTRGKNPVDLAENLRGIDLTMRTGNGQPGGPGGDTGDPVEMEVHEEAINLHDRLNELAIGHVFDDYGAGGHAWYYWQRDLVQLVRDLPAVFADPPAAPTSITYKTIDTDFTVYGWHVTIDRPALEFAKLADATARGFSLAGSGKAVVTTARVAKPGTTLRATLATADGTSSTTLLTADRSGRVQLNVPLGPGNPDQQYSPQAQVSGTRVYTTRVTLKAVKR